MGSVHYRAFKTIVRKWTPHGLIYILRYNPAGGLESFISAHPEVWTPKQRQAFQDLYFSIHQEIYEQFEKRAAKNESKDDFFASLKAEVEAEGEIDPEMYELCWSPEKELHGHWPQAYTQGLKYWFCPQCSRTYWWGPWGTGRDTSGQPSVKCCHCWPPHPGGAAVCGRGEQHPEMPRVSIWGKVIPYEDEERPQQAGAEWENTQVKAMWNWATKACLAPTATSARRYYPRKFFIANMNTESPL